MSHKPAHLLLVDDDPGLLKLLGLRLRDGSLSREPNVPEGWKAEAELRGPED